jgi:NAD(P)-dependent dehydrogenase (short-subunit alcohol dehydrogenase family)
MSVDLSGRVAIITGASRGIGRAIALAFAKAGARVALASRKAEGLEEVAREIEAGGGNALAVATHVGQEDAVEALIERTVEAFGGIDILVNNAGTNPHFGPVLTATTAQWDKILEVNLRSAFLLIQRALPHLEARGGGKIINMASVAGLHPSLGMGIYGISKAGLIMLTHVLARELGPQHIQVNAIAPGVIKTRLSSALWESPDLAEALTRSTPLGRLGDVDDVVGAALYLASSLSDYVTGEVLVVDGGMSLVGGIG